MQEDKIKEALVELLYRNSYGVVASNVGVSLAAVFVLRDAAPAGWLGAWVAALYLLILARVLVARRFFHRRRESGPLTGWAWLAAGFSWVSGLLWGILGWIGFLPEEPFLLSFTIVALTGLICGTVPSLSAFPPALVGSILATIAPVALRMIEMPGEISYAYLFLLACLVTINFYYCRVTYRMLRETVRLRLENVELISDLEEERDRAQAADRAKTRFLAAASHDLRQPIHALSLLVSALAMLARRGDVPSSEASDLAGKAKSIVGNLSGLLNALLDISKLDAGVVTVARQSVDLRELLRNLRSEFAASAMKKGLEWRVVECDLRVDTDPMMLKRILDNLLTNAFRYTQSGRVLLGCRRRGASVEIQIWDTGPGIPHDKHAAIFEEFVQLQNPSRDRAQGLGLGLAIVRRTAELLRHKLKLNSVPGHGSMFSITVPVLRKAPAPAPVVLGPGSAEPLGIMVIEDEQDILDAVVRLLTLDGHRVYAGGSVAETMRVRSTAERTGEASIDLIIADYRLRHGATGLEAIEALRAHLGYAVPAIVVTGDTSPSRLKEVSAGKCLLLHKPVSGEQLQDAINQAVADGRSRRASRS
ncbi:hybrid sensor histidine kinase/response regulator [Aquamicrobium sp. LC103]|uniref:ATP-binding response regulator n=1 Tax=Aquamicrobium sp. LC103 TaxID=1120658 RepID=UPI00063E9699|nr:hybrid sensor histidine kinase/response regulator [Aquamicrobium sp. LC103]TKT76148.1 hybrid sensor histidine kinase/response regulator [Aquamicrobium sp. LC103]